MHRMKVGYANFSWFVPEIGQAIKVPRAIVERRADGSRPLMCVYLSSGFGEDQSSTFWHSEWQWKQEAQLSPRDLRD